MQQTWKCKKPSDRKGFASLLDTFTQHSCWCCSPSSHRLPGVLVWSISIFNLQIIALNHCLSEKQPVELLAVRTEKKSHKLVFQILFHCAFSNLIVTHYVQAWLATSFIIGWGNKRKCFEFNWTGKRNTSNIFNTAKYFSVALHSALLASLLVCCINAKCSYLKPSTQFLDLHIFLW